MPMNPAHEADLLKERTARQMAESGLKWAIFVNQVTGDLAFANLDGEVWHLEKGEAPHVAAALAEYCEDDDERSFVSDMWS